jgi:hypothetical protein
MFGQERPRIPQALHYQRHSQFMARIQSPLRTMPLYWNLHLLRRPCLFARVSGYKMWTWCSRAMAENSVCIRSSGREAFNPKRSNMIDSFRVRHLSVWFGVGFILYRVACCVWYYAVQCCQLMGYDARLWDSSSPIFSVGVLKVNRTAKLKHEEWSFFWRYICHELNNQWTTFTKYNSLSNKIMRK